MKQNLMYGTTALQRSTSGNSGGTARITPRAEETLTGPYGRKPVQGTMAHIRAINNEKQ
ncbi:MAG: hypothetical protein Q8Q13_00760 [bacterium]|nr:hypothetical protein [bacterium]